MNPGGRFAPQSQLSETAKDGALLRGFGGAPLRSRFPSADCGKNPAKKRDGQTNGHDSGGVPQIRDPSESDRSGKMGCAAPNLVVLEFLALAR